MNMKKIFLPLFVVAIAVLVICGTTSCKNVAKLGGGSSSDSDSVAVASESVSSELPRTLDNAPAPKGNITTWLVAGFNEDGYARMFIVEGDESRFVQDNLGTTDTIYVLRLVSYEQTEDEKEQTEDGGTYESFGGPLVVDAYDPATKEFVGRYDGSYSGGSEYDQSGEFLHGGESYSGTFTKADGTKEEFSYYGD